MESETEMRERKKTGTGLCCCNCYVRHFILRWILKTLEPFQISSNKTENMFWRTNNFTQNSMPKKFVYNNLIIQWILIKLALQGYKKYKGYTKSAYLYQSMKRVSILRKKNVLIKIFSYILRFLKNSFLKLH